MIARLLRARAEWRRNLERLASIEESLAATNHFMLAMNHELRLELATVREEAALLIQQQSAWLRSRLSIDIDAVRNDAGEAIQAAGARASELAEAVRDHSQRHAEELVGQTRVEMVEQLALLRRNIDALRSSDVRDGVESVVFDRQSQTIDPSLYAALEDRFHGSSEEIRARQEHYVAYVQGSVDSDHPLVDLGAGRAEWLALLRDRGIAAFGIDESPAFVKAAAARQLDVREGDLVDYLRAVKPGTLGAVSMFQVLEHLPTPIVLDVLRNGLAALGPGGVFMVETPNSLNLAVAASTFWIDPTHVVPIHPALLQFLAETVGFVDIELVFSNPVEADYPSSELPGPVDALVRRMYTALFGPQDVTLIARAPMTSDEVAD